MAVTDLTPPRAAHRTRFADRERREVIVVHVALERLRAQAVDALFVGDGAESCRGEYLRFAAREQAGAMRAGHNGGAARDRTDFVQTAAVGPDALIDNHGPKLVLFACLDALVEI